MNYEQELLELQKQLTHIHQMNESGNSEPLARHKASEKALNHVRLLIATVRQEARG